MLENLRRLLLLSALLFLRVTKSCQRLKPVVIIMINIIRLRRQVTRTHAKVQKIRIIGEHWKARSKEQIINICKSRSCDSLVSRY
jgi:hypothetical protein